MPRSWFQPLPSVTAGGAENLWAIIQSCSELWNRDAVVNKHTNMGVKGLWQLLEPTGRPVTLESLEGKVLAVGILFQRCDWLHAVLVTGQQNSCIPWFLPRSKAKWILDVCSYPKKYSCLSLPPLRCNCREHKPEEKCSWGWASHTQAAEGSFYTRGQLHQIRSWKWHPTQGISFGVFSSADCEKLLPTQYLPPPPIFISWQGNHLADALAGGPTPREHQEECHLIHQAASENHPISASRTLSFQTQMKHLTGGRGVCNGMSADNASANNGGNFRQQRH